MVNGDRHTDLGLSLLLQRWRVPTPAWPSFGEEVWRRIAALQRGKKRSPTPPGPTAPRGRP
jgi:hypothetical protein